MKWIKSRRSFSNGNCVEVTKLTAAEDAEVFSKMAAAHPKLQDLDTMYLMRDSKTSDGPVLAFTPEEWEAFTLGVKDGEFDLPSVSS